MYKQNKYELNNFYYISMITFSHHLLLKLSALKIAYLGPAVNKESNKPVTILF